MKVKQLFRISMILGSGLVTMVSCKGKSEQSAPDQAMELAVLTIGEEDATLDTGYPASLHGKNDVEIRPQITGFLTSVNVEEGQKVSKGQVLFTIDQVTLKAAVDAAKAAVGQAQASVNVSQANVNTAQTNASNNKMLLDKNIISASAYQVSVDALNAAKAQMQQAKAALAQAQAQLVSAQKNLSYSVITAPVSGVIGNIDFKTGALVSPQSLLTVISNNGEMEAYFSMNEKEVLALTKNGTRSLQAALDSLPAVELKLANGEIYGAKGKIVTLSGVLDPTTGSATAKAVFPNEAGMLRTGNTGQVLVPSITKDAIQIPQKATYEVQNMRFAYVLDKDNKAHSTPITVSELNDGVNFIVTSGLKPGDRIVVEGVGVSVKDDMKITPKVSK